MIVHHGNGLTFDGSRGLQVHLAGFSRGAFKYLFVPAPEVKKTGSANPNFLCNFSQLPLSNISLFTVLFTADVGFFSFFL